MNTIRITDLDAVPEFSRLTEAQLKRTGENGLFIAESINVIKAALDKGLRPRSLLSEEGHLKDIERELGLRLNGAPVYTAEPDTIIKLTGYRLHRGVLAAFERFKLPSVGEVLEGVNRVAVLENVTDAENVGAVIRSAAALNMDAVLVSPSSCDPLNRRAARVSMGAVFRLPWTVVPCPEDDRNAVSLDALKENGFTVCALALEDNALAVGSDKLRGIKKLAIVLGAEGNGLSERTIRDSDCVAAIPMAHGMDSLNVAAAAAVAFFAVTTGRQDR